MAGALALFAILGVMLGACEEDNGAKSNKAFYVYVANGGPNAETISAFVMDEETGEINEIAGSPFSGIPGNTELTVHPGFQALFAHDAGPFLTYKGIDLESGKLSSVPGAGQTVAGGSTHIAFTPDGGMMYASDLGGAQIRLYDFDAATPKLTERGNSPLLQTDAQTDVAIEPGGKFLYAPDFAAGDIMSFKINATNGALTPTSGSPFPLGAYANWIVPDPMGKFIFVADSSTNAVHSLTFNATSGNLALKDSAPGVGVSINSLSVNAQGTFLYLATGAGVYIYSVNRTSGNLSLVSGSPFFGTVLPFQVAATPDGKFLLVPDGSFDFVAVAEIDAGGVPTLVPGASADTGDNPMGVVILDPEAATP
jgi:DNA-binding beta-propeller fold protein YncE